MRAAEVQHGDLETGGLDPYIRCEHRPHPAGHHSRRHTADGAANLADERRGGWPQVVGVPVYAEFALPEGMRRGLLRRADDLGARPHTGGGRAELVDPRQRDAELLSGVQAPARVVLEGPRQRRQLGFVLVAVELEVGGFVVEAAGL